MRADITRISDMLRITRGVDAIVHLGGYSVEGPWPLIQKANIEGCYNAYEALAAQQGAALHLSHQQPRSGLLSP